MSDQSTYSTPFPAPLTDAQTKSLEQRALECLREDGVEDPESKLESLALIRALSAPEDPLLDYGRERLSKLVDSAMAAVRPGDEEACIGAFKTSLCSALTSEAFSECSAGPNQWTLLKGHFDPGNETWDITREEVNATSYVDRYAGRES